MNKSRYNLCRSYKYLLLVLVLIIASCNVHLEKRKYSKGFYIVSAKKNKSNLSKISQPLDDLNQEVSYSKEVIPLKESSNPDRFQLEKKSISTQQNQPTLSITLKEKKLLIINNESKNKIHGNTSISAKKIKSRSSKNTKKGWPYLFLIGGFSGMMAFGVFYLFRNKLAKLSRWSKNNSKTSLFLVLLTGSALSYVSFNLGKELFHIGYTFSNMICYFLGVISISGSASLIHRNKKKVFHHHHYFKRRLLYLFFGTTFLMNGVAVGNQAEQRSTANNLAGAIYNHTKSVQDYSEQTSQPSKEGLIFLYIILGIILLVGILALCCAVWCIALFSSAVIPLSIFATFVTIALLYLYYLTIKRWGQNIERKFPSRID